MEKVISGDKSDYKIAVLEKLDAHQTTLLHSPISVFISKLKGKSLIQYRILSKYHSGGIGTNACCTRQTNETNSDTAKKRLGFETGMTYEPNVVFNFSYRKESDNELIENESDHVFYSITEQTPDSYKNEVMKCKYFPNNQLAVGVKNYPDNYNVWFKIITDRVANETNKAI